MTDKPTAATTTDRVRALRARRKKAKHRRVDADLNPMAQRALDRLVKETGQSVSGLIGTALIQMADSMPRERARD
jgi:hypothetical protein